MDSLKVNSIHYFMERRQLNIKRRLALLKVTNLVQDKIKGHMYSAIAKISE